MANTSSARKAARKIARRTEINKARRSRMRGALRKVEEAIASGDRNKALEAMKNAEPALMRAARQGQVHRNTASRKVSRLTHQIAKLAQISAQRRADCSAHMLRYSPAHQPAACRTRVRGRWRRCAATLRALSSLLQRCHSVVRERAYIRSFTYSQISLESAVSDAVRTRGYPGFRSRNRHVDKGLIGHSRTRSWSRGQFAARVATSGIEFVRRRRFAAN